MRSLRLILTTLLGLLGSAGLGSAEDPLPPGVLARLAAKPWRGLQGIDAVAVSPDGKRLAAVGARSLRLWRLDGGEAGSVGGGASSCGTVAFSPDGKRIAAGNWGHGVTVWDSDLKGQGTQLLGHQGSVTCVGFSPDNAQAVSGSDDRTVQLWDLARSTEVRRFEGHDGLITAVAFGPEGKSVISASLDRTVRVWDVGTGKELRRLEGHRDQVLAIRLLPDGGVVTASMDHTLRIWDVTTGKEKRRLEGHAMGVPSVDATADGKRLVSASLDGTVRIWDAATGKELLEFMACESGVRAVAFLPDGKSLVSGDEERFVRRWDATTGKELEHFIVKNFTPGSTDTFDALSWAPDGQRIVTASTEGIRIWEAATGKMLRLLGRLMDTVWGLAWSPDGKTIAAVGRRDGTVHVWNAVSGEELFLYGPAHKGGVSKVAFSPDSKRLASGGGSFDPSIYIWDTQTGKLLITLTAPMNFLDGLAWSPDGKRLASISRDEVLRVWDVEAGKEQRQLQQGAARTFRGLAWSPDGRWLATIGDDRAVLWDPDGVREPMVLSDAGTQGAHAVAFAPDGRTVVLGTQEEAETLGLWETATGQRRAKFLGAKGAIAAAAFSPDGRRVAAAGSAGDALIWDITGLHGLHGQPMKKLTAEELKALWEKLGGEGMAAHAAIWRLSLAPEQAVSAVAERLRPAAPVDGVKVARWLAELDDDSFMVRQRASRELEKLGDQVEEALQKTAKQTNSLEVRLRVRALLEKLEGPRSSPERLRQLRSLEVLEHAASREARELLRELAKGAPEAWLTREARSVLHRMNLQ